MNPDLDVSGAVQLALATVDLRLIAPEIIMTMTGLLCLVFEKLLGKGREQLVGWLTVLGSALAIIALNPGREAEVGFSNLIVVDGFAVFFKLLFLSATILVVGLSMRYLDEEQAQHGEYYALLCFATVGMMFMASGADLIMIFVGLELMALSSYVLVGLLRESPRSGEAAMKYFILGAFSTGFFVYGISLFYGVTGHTSLAGIAANVASANSLTILALIMMSVGLAFKVAAVPFHAWAPDVYEGAPTPITAYLSVASKAAAFAVLVRVLLIGLYDLRAEWSMLVMVLAVASMTLGNVVAIVQDNVKRMLAYSSIAHAGYVLVGVLAAGASPPERLLEAGMGPVEQLTWLSDLQSWAQGGILLYLLAYTFMNIGAFALVIYLRRQEIVGDHINDFAGLAKNSPMAALAMTVFLLSLGGMPPTAGYIGKLWLFGSAIQAELYAVAAIAVLNTAVSMYFYLRIVAQMWLKEPRTDKPYAISWQWAAAVAICLAITLGMGLFPQRFVNLAQKSLLEPGTTSLTITSLH